MNSSNVRTLRRGSVALSLLLACVVAPAFGFGEKGHRIHGELTWKLLDKQTRDKLGSILKDETLADIGNWADQIRDDRPETRSWHFVNLPKDATNYDAARDCHAEGCVVGKLEEYEKVFADPKQTAEARLEALRWLVHLTADLHQPLHVALLEDKGGNDLQVTFFGRNTNLHRVWDTDMIERFDQDSRTYAEDLFRDIRPEDVAEWQKGTPADWATESWKLANSVAYVDVRGKRIENGDKLGRAYWMSRSDVLDTQLKKAAARLALILKRSLADPPTDAAK